LVSFRLKPENSNSHGFELYRPSIKGTKLLLKVIKAIIVIKQKRNRLGTKHTSINMQHARQVQIRNRN